MLEIELLSPEFMELLKKWNEDYEKTIRNYQE